MPQVLSLPGRALLLLVLLLAACSPGESSRAAAREVLQLMRFDESLQLAVHYPPATPRGVRDPESLNRCLMGYDTHKVFEEVVSLYATHLSRAELTEMAAFFRSEAGRARVRWALTEGYLRRGLSVPVDVPVRNDALDAAMARFAATEAGRKMDADAPLGQAVSGLLQTESKQRFTECMQQAQAT
ncbi:MAG: DUF2059 domain-containing protein [Rhodocyclaceae bacterium]